MIASNHARVKAFVTSLGLLAVVAAVIVNIATGVQKVRNQGMNAHAHRMRLHTDIQYTMKLRRYEISILQIISPVSEIVTL